VSVGRELFCTPCDTNINYKLEWFIIQQHGKFSDWKPGLVLRLFHCTCAVNGRIVFVKVMLIWSQVYDGKLWQQNLIMMSIYIQVWSARHVAIAKKADRTVYAIVLCTPYRIAAEPNRRKCRVWNSHGHVTTLPMAIPGAKISAVRVFIVLWQNDTSHSNCG